MDDGVTIVIPVHDDEQIRRCLGSIDDPRARVLVSLDRPTDAVRRIVDELGVETTESPLPGGVAACEHGLQAASTRHVLFTDSDCVFRPGTVSQFVDAAGSAHFVRGLVLFGHKTAGQKRVALVRHLHTNGPSTVYKVPLMVDREILDRLGGHLFDSRLRWTEDFHLTARIRDLGLSVRRLKSAAVMHSPLDMGEDLRRAVDYGVGHAHGRSMGLAGYGQPKINPVRTYRAMAKAFDHGVARYGLAWKVAFQWGYLRGRRRHPKPNFEERP